MEITIRILFGKFGYSTSKAYVDIPIKFADDPQIKALLDSGYRFTGTKVLTK
jgi:hypothetical protein